MYEWFKSGKIMQEQTQDTMYKNRVTDKRNILKV